MANTAMQGWGQGVTLWEAVEKYSPPNKWDEFVKFETATPPNAFGQRTRINREPGYTPPPGVTNFNIGSTLQLMRRELQTDVCRLIQEGRLLTAGYRKPKTRGSEPVWIDAAHWLEAFSNNQFGRGIDWIKSELIVGHFAFEEVRVLPSPEFGRDMTRSARAQQNGPGAPSFKLAIVAAYRELVARGEIDFSKSVNANLPVIQEAVRNRVDPRIPLKKFRGVGYDSVRKAIGTEFEQDKARLSSE